MSDTPTLFPLARFALAAAISATATLTHAEGSANWTLGVGVEYSAGKYGTTATTESLSIPVRAQYRSGDWQLGLTVPYLQVTGDGSVIVSGRQSGRRTSTTTTSQRTTVSGLGDIVAAVTRNLSSAEDSAIGLDLTGRIKFGTASQNMGSGLNDYAIQLASYGYEGEFSPGIMLGYEVLGDTTTQPLNDVAYGALSGNYQIGEHASAGVEYRYSQRASDTGYEQREVALYASRRFASDMTLSLYAMQGLSDGSPDTGFGLSLAARY